MLEIVLAGIMYLLIWYPTCVTTLFSLGVLAYYDTKYREIDTSVFIALMPGIVLSYVILYLLGRLTNMMELIPCIVTTLIVVILVYLMSRAGYMGEGDVAIVAITGILNPYIVRIYNIYTTPLVLSILFGIVYILYEMLRNVAHNIRRLDEFKQVTRGVGGLSKATYFLFGKVMSAGEFREKKNYFPLLDTTGKYMRKTAKVGVEPLRGDEYGVDRGYVIATHGLAFSNVVLTGYILTLIYISITTFTSGHPCTNCF